MTDIFNYNPDEVHVLAWGIPLTGMADGTFVNISKDVMPFSAKRTADGTVSRLYNSDQTYTVTLTLHNGSDSNNTLTRLWQLDEITQRGKFPLMVKDLSGSDLFFSTNTWIEQVPEVIKSSSVDTRVWVLRSSFAVINIGGNLDPSDIVEDLLNSALSAFPALQGIL